MSTEAIALNHEKLYLRPYEERDIPYHAKYFFQSPGDFLESVGFDLEKLKDPAGWETTFRRKLLEDKALGKPPVILIGEFEGRAISMVSLDQRNPDGASRLHFHIYEPNLRGKGFGKLIFMAGVKEFSRIYNIERFLIEPKASNKPMNALMRKLGFTYIKDYILEPGSYSQRMMVSQYEIIPPK